MKKFLNFKINDKNWKLISELKNVVFSLLIIIDFLFIIIISFIDISYNNLVYMATFDLFICILLFVQLCYDFTNYEYGLKSFIIDHIADIIAMIPFNFIFLRYLAVFRIARLLQFLQVFRLLTISNEKSGSLKFFIQNRLLKLMIVIVFLYLLFSSVTLKKIDPAFTSLFDAFWFNLVTITSVGYGDLTPVTESGKVIAMLSIVLGIMFVSVFTAAMSAIYMEKPEEITRNHFKKEFELHVEKLKEENILLHDEISNLKYENKKLNDKLDKILELLGDGGSDDET